MIARAILLQESFMPAGTYTNRPLAEKILAAVSTRYRDCTQGFGPCMPKAACAQGTFTPSPEAAKLTHSACRAGRRRRSRCGSRIRQVCQQGRTGQRSEVLGPARDSGAIPPGRAQHTDIVAHSSNSFPARTGRRVFGVSRGGDRRCRRRAGGAGVTWHPGGKRMLNCRSRFPRALLAKLIRHHRVKFTNAAGAKLRARSVFGRKAASNIFLTMRRRQKSLKLNLDEFGPQLTTTRELRWLLRSPTQATM